ncbi:MAG: DUF2752 domain-containing protein [Armatimonadetes bacterium]|nr:DUF2752 domain-containing protein [Armatimonadota bacterium]MDW8028093.1 DUF2752 domain-containing protein [Armatimonadota bacterium]
MGANWSNLQGSGLIRHKSSSRVSWRVGRIFYLIFVLIVTLIAYFLPSLPYQPPLCLFKLMTGYPCAGCGMTRSFEAAARGRFLEAFQWHPIGLAIFFGIWLGSIFVIYELLSNKTFDWEGLLRRWGALLAWSLFFAFLALWLLRLSYYQFGQWLPLPLKFPL